MRILHVGYGFRPWRRGGVIAYAEDIMEAQASSGHDVSYFFRGRHYPLYPNDRLHSWTRRGIAMHETLNSTLVFGEEHGTLTPEADLVHPPSERAFVQVLNKCRPEVIHVQEIIGLPTSLIDVAVANGIPTVMTLQDYFPLCPVIKLFDIDEQRCHRHQVGAQCARCSMFAPGGRRMFRGMTAAYELRRLLGPQRGDRAAAAGQRLLERIASSGGTVGEQTPGEEAARVPPVTSDDLAAPLRYQGRRDVNVERLSRLDALVAQSRRVAEIYTDLGVDPTRVRTLHLTLRHLSELRPQRFSEIPKPVRLVTLNGATTRMKGAEVITGAVERLQREGLGRAFTLDIFGYTADWARAQLEATPNVRVRGPYASGEIDRILDGYHVGVIPSIWEEAYGYVGPEFLSKGIPIIGNARGGIVDYTHDGTTGWVNHSADSPGLAAIIRGIVQDPGQILQRNQWIVDHRDELVKPLDRHLSELEQLYDEVIASTRERRRNLIDVAAASRVASDRS